MKSHEESASKKEKSTEDKAKETGKIPLENAYVHQKCVFSCWNKLYIFDDAV